MQSLAELVIWLATFCLRFFALFVTEKVREKMVVLTLLDDDETFDGKRKLINYVYKLLLISRCWLNFEAFYVSRQKLNKSFTENRFRSKFRLLEGVSTKCVGFSGSSLQLASSF